MSGPEDKKKNSDVPPEEKLFEPPPEMDETWANAIQETQLQGGADLRKLLVGRKLKVQTASGRTYILERREDGYYLSGHPKYCPEPTRVINCGSLLGTSLRIGFIGRGSRMEFTIPGREGVGTTSPVVEVEEIPEGGGEGK